jgi:hypothetical protein
MKRLLLLLYSTFIIHHSTFSQTPGEWAWIHGSNTFSSVGNFGTLGVPSPTNEPPAFYEPAEWTDRNGNLWLFSGVNPANQFNNDLWKYDPLTNQWTWMNGNGVVNDLGSYGIKGIPGPI